MRVMNVKFVGRIIMTVLFVFICIGAHADDAPLKYEIRGRRSRCTRYLFGKSDSNPEEK